MSPNNQSFSALVEAVEGFFMPERVISR